MHRSIAAISTLLFLLLVAGCGEDSATARMLESPAGPGSLAPRWSVPPGEAPLLSWLEPSGDGHALRYSRLLGDAFSDPVTVVTGADWFVNWADTPSVVLLPGGRMAAHWLAKSGPGTYSYDIRMGLSNDGGASWIGYFNPHDDGTQTEHGFARMIPEPGTVGMVWLDGRRTVEEKPMTLRYGRFDIFGETVDAAELDASVCDCCMTGVARTADGLLVVYRDRTEDEIRDIYRVVRTEDGWSEPAPVAADGWRIAACPVNGPAVAARDDRVAVAWFTAAGGEPAVKLAFSTDSGRQFGEPLIVDESDPVGRVDLVLDDEGAAWVSWLDADKEDGRIRVQRFSDEGAVSGAFTVAEVSTARASGFPVLARFGSDLLLAWTDPERNTVPVARVTPPGQEPGGRQKQ